MQEEAGRGRQLACSYQSYHETTGRGWGLICGDGRTSKAVDGVQCVETAGPHRQSRGQPLRSCILNTLSGSAREVVSSQHIGFGVASTHCLAMC